MIPFSVIVADPAWMFTDPLPGNKRGASSHYKCMSYADLMSYELPPLADDCALFMWRVGAMAEMAYDLCRDWGFTPSAAEIVWDKQTKHGKEHFGMGRIVRNSHEVCLIATRGKPKVASRSVRSRFSAPVGRHSAKPEKFFDIVESLYAGPYVEIFARRHRHGWKCIGDELEQGQES